MNWIEKSRNQNEKFARITEAAYRAQSEGAELTMYFSRMMLEEANRVNDPGAKMSAYNLLGMSYSRNGEMDSSIISFREFVRIAKQHNDKEKTILALTNLAVAYYEIGDYSNTFETAEQIMTSAKANNDTINLAKMNALYAGVYLKQKEFEKALKFGEISLKYNLAKNDTPSIVTSLNVMAIANQNMLNFDTAVKLYKQCISLNEGYSHTFWNALVDAYHNLGSLYLQLQDYSEAKKYLRHSLEISEEYDLVHGKTSAYSTLSNLCLKTNQPGLALIYADSTLHFLSMRDQLDRRQEILNYKSRAYAALGQYKKAYEIHVLYFELYDSLQQKLSQKEVQKLQTAFETEQKVIEKEQRIALLEKEQEFLEKEKELTANRTYYLIAALVLAALAALALFNRFLVKRKSEKQLAEAYADVTQQKELVEKKNENIEDSIRYAKRIQMAILPSTAKLNEIFPESAVYYKAKDIVSGDFYWATVKGGAHVLAAVDCTGHGVPGAFMSVMGYDLLNEIVNGQGVADPGQILTELNVKVYDALHKQSNSDQTDGMDAAICAWQPDSGTLLYAGAHRPLYRLAGAEIEIIKGDKRSIGNGSAEKFTTREFRPRPGERFFMFSDGVTDQFGGERGRKYSPKRLQAALLKYRETPFNELSVRLEEEFAAWSEGHAQIDDVMIVGFMPVPTG